MTGLARTVVLLAAAVSMGLTASAQPAADRSQPPEPGPARPLQIPPVQRLELSNGLRVLLVETHEVPVVQVSLVVRAGAAADPAGRAGVASMTADMLDEGAGGKNALELADAVDFLGASLETATDWDFTAVELHVPVARLGEALPLMTDVALDPDFPERELERLRKQALTGLLQARDVPGAIGSAALAQAVFGKKHRYALPQSGDASSLAALAVDDLRSFHQRHFRPANAALIVVGDVSRAVLDTLEKSFGAWPAGGDAVSALPEPRQLNSRSIWLVDRPGSPQSTIRLGRVGPARSTNDYHALRVMNTLLGGSFASRLNDNLREQHGYTYGAGSFFAHRRTAGLFLAGSDVHGQYTAEALGEFMKELEAIQVAPTAEEAKRARNYLALGYAEEFETTGQIAGQIAQQFVYDLPEDFFNSFVPTALAVDAEQMAKVATAHIDLDSLAIIIVGDRATVEEPLEKLGLGPIRTLTIEDVMGPAPEID